MLNNLEIFEFFKAYPKQFRPKCIEEVLIYGIRALKKQTNSEIPLPVLLEINGRPMINTKKDLTPKFKDSKKEILQDTDRLRLITTRKYKENIGPDTTCLPLKHENRRAQSTQLQTTKFKPLSAGIVPMGRKLDCKLNGSLEKESEIIRLADEFLKNPFARSLTRPKPLISSPGFFLDSNVFSTIEITSPSLYIDN